MYRGVRQRSRGIGKRWLLLVLALVLLVAGAGFAYLKFGRADDKLAPHASAGGQQQAEEKQKPALLNLQPTVDAWVAGQKGEYGIVVYDPDNNAVIAIHNPGTQFFTASIYKLYAVYLALEDIEAGKHALDEPYKFGKTRQQCLRDAIHSSDSPCAEALLNEIGQAEVTARLKAYQLTDTSFPAFLTTAQDAMTILQRLHSRMDLEENSANLMYEAMKTQIYRDGLAKGMSQAVVATKVGFSETPHYHETGVITLPNGREYLVSFFSKGVGPSVLADFGATILEALK